MFRCLTPFMPRNLPLGNGSLLINFDNNYNLRDIYWPHTGQELHTGGDISHTGIWVDGEFSWFDAPEWQRDLRYNTDTLVTHVTLTHPRLAIQVLFQDTVDFARPLFLRSINVKNLGGSTRQQIRLFFHYDWHIW